MFKKITATALTASLLLGTLTAMPAAADAETLPDWVPQDFVSAMQFNEEHGATYAADGVFCTVRMKTDPSSPDRELFSDGLEPVYRQTLECDLTEEDLVEPDPSDPDFRKKMEEYEQKLRAYGIGRYKEEIDLIRNTTFDVAVYKPEENGSYSVKSMIETSAELISENTYTFDLTDNGITETDLYGWVPDCVSEYNDFQKMNGELSAHGKYIIYCGDVNYSTGAELTIEMDENDLEQIYNGGVSRLADRFLAGNAAHLVKVYQAKKPGMTFMKFTTAIPWAPPEAANEISGNFMVHDDLSIDMIIDVVVAPVEGDVTGDYKADIRDIIMLQKYLLGCGSLTNSSNADLNGDNCVDIFDLALLKRLVISSAERPLDPEPPVDDRDPKEPVEQSGDPEDQDTAAEVRAIELDAPEDSIFKIERKDNKIFFTGAGPDLPFVEGEPSVSVGDFTFERTSEKDPYTKHYNITDATTGATYQLHLFRCNAFSMMTFTDNDINGGITRESVNGREGFLCEGQMFWDHDGGIALLTYVPQNTDTAKQIAEHLIFS